MSLKSHCTESKTVVYLDKQQILGRQDDKEVGYGFIVLYQRAWPYSALLIPFCAPHFFYKQKTIKESHWQRLIGRVGAAVNFLQSTLSQTAKPLATVTLVSEQIQAYLCFTKKSTPEA